jgi:hypothetical protein
MNTPIANCVFQSLLDIADKCTTSPGKKIPHPIVVSICIVAPFANPNQPAAIADPNHVKAVASFKVNFTLATLSLTKLVRKKMVMHKKVVITIP